MIIIFIIGVLLIGANEAVGFYFSECQDMDIIDCSLSLVDGEEEEEEQEEGTVVATGQYDYKDFSVTVTANIPLEGGSVTGSVSGTCSGKVSGTYNGQNNGAISGKLSGACSPFIINIPAGADYGGTVNKTSKTVPINFTGRGGGLTHEGSMTLTYQ